MKSFNLHRILIHCATFFALLCSAKPVLPDPALEHEVKVRYPEKEPRLTLRVVIGEAHKDQIDYFKNLALESVRMTETIFGIPFKDDFSIVFDPRADYHNGLTTTVPTNRVYVHTEVPTLESSIGLVREAHLETTVHELAHMIMIQQRRGVFVPLGWVFGNLSRPNALFPRWVHEGMAVWAESFLGGRGHSGIIQAEIRKYAEFYQRNKKHPLRSDLMDGSLELSAVEPGNVPYHFGYLLIDDLMNTKDGKSAGELMKKSATLPGWFFHRLFRKNGKVMTDRFNALRDQWAATKLEETPARKTVLESRSITGPFVSGAGLSWVHTKDKRMLLTSPDAFLVYHTAAGGGFGTTFTRSGTRTVQAMWSAPLEKWVLLTYSINQNQNQDLRKTIALLDKEGNFLCENTEVDRIREIAIDGPTVAWIRSDEKGLFYFEKAPIDEKCRLGSTTTLYSGSVPFERLSHPWLQGPDWLLAKGRGRDLSRDTIIGNSFEYSAPEGALAHPQYVTIDGKKSLLVSWYQKDFRGPALIDPATKNIRSFAIKTEAPATYMVPGSTTLTSRVGLWDKDQIQEIPLTENAVSKEIPVANPGTDKNEFSYPDLEKAPPGENGTRPLKNYGAWPSVFPHFWFPNVEAYDRGTQVSGSTFFSDLSGRWSGAATLGYDTGAQRPMAYFSLARSHLREEGMLDKWEIEATSNFRFIGLKVQDVMIARSRFRLMQKLNSRFHFAVYPGVEYRRGSSISVLPKYEVAAPIVSFLFASPHAQDVRQNAYQITNFSDAFYFNSNHRWLPEPSMEIYSNFQGKFWRLGYLLGLEYGKTQEKSFPIVYYEWGGRPDFSTLDTGFLARGFPPTIGPALQILRANAEVGFKLWNFDRGLPWNRFHVKDIELRPIYEVVTTDLHRPTTAGLRKTNIRMGKQYFQTVGAELDVFFQALHYLDFKVSVGYFHGMGRSGQDHVGIRLASLTDFL